MTIETLIARYGLAAIFVGAGLEGETAVVTGGLLAHQAMLPFWGSAIAAITGSFAADQLFFFAGRHYRDTKRIRAMREKPAFSKALETLERHPTAFILGFRFLYGLRTISPIAIGTSRIPFRTFLVLNAVSAVIWGLMFTTIGYLFGHSLLDLFARFLPKDKTVALAIGVGVVVGGILVIRGVRRYLANRDANRSGRQGSTSSR